MDAGVPIKQPVAGISVGLVMDRGQVRPADRHPGRRGPLRRHGLQGGRHAEGHHRHPARHQARRHHRGRSSAARWSRPRRRRLQILKTMLATLAGPAEGDQRVRPAAAPAEDQPGEDRQADRPRRQEDPRHPGGDRARRSTSRTTARCRSRRPTRRAPRPPGGMVEALTAEVKVGAIYDGKVISHQGVRGVHRDRPGPRRAVPHLANSTPGTSAASEDVVQIGDKVQVKVIAIDDQGRVKLSPQGAAGRRAKADEGGRRRRRRRRRPRRRPG